METSVETEKVSPEVRWERRLGQLQEFQRQHGHFRMPRNGEWKKLAEWLAAQLHAARTGALRQDRLARLEGIGWTWSAETVPAEERWERRYQQLLKYRERFGHCNVPNKWGEDVVFGHWVQTQRASKKRGLLSAERIRRLEEVGFQWEGRAPRPAAGAAGVDGEQAGQPQGVSAREEAWKQRLAELVAFHREYGAKAVPRTDPKFKQLHTWLCEQRNRARRGQLNPQRIALLEGCGYPWRGAPRRREGDWQARMLELAAFRETHGHSNVPTRSGEHTALGWWLREQRRRVSRGLLSEEQRRQLEATGVTAAPPRETRWQQQLAGLTAFFREHGPRPVPVGDPQFKKLCVWLHEQRKNAKGGKLSPQRIALLDGCGYPWRGRQRPHCLEGEQLLQELAAFCREHGPHTIPNKPPLDRLASWVHRQRFFFKRGQLPADRIAALDATGYPWREPQQRRAQNAGGKYMAQLEAFVREHGHARVPRGEYPALAQWLCTQRCDWRRGKLRGELAERLKALGVSPEIVAAYLPVAWQEQWSKRLAEVAAFIREHGHCAVNQHQPQYRELARWITGVRYEYRHERLRSERIQQLKAIGFVFNAQAALAARRQARWEDRFREAAEYRLRHSNWHISKRDPKTQRIAAWMIAQRKEYAEGKLSPDRIRRLQAIGFSFERRIVSHPPSSKPPQDRAANAPTAAP
ncbi:MAG: helicase associated domain-containing protein [Verrucomicrobia bacterium]|nr:helicase associated domain-containing protein [Verrucomicrobiota bacterium]